MSNIYKIVDKIVNLPPSTDAKKLKHHKNKLNLVSANNNKLDRSVETAIINLSKQVKKISLDLETGPVVDINRMIDDVNTLHSLLNTNNTNIPYIKGEYSCEAAVIVTSRVEPAIPLTLKSGSRLILTTRTLDLSTFSNDELHEILSVLDVLAPDDRYDTLRTSLTEEIAKRT
jgi:hypothetical protein